MCLCVPVSLSVSNYSLCLLQLCPNLQCIPPETLFYGKKYGRTVRYRKSGKTLCSLFPEKSGFTVLINLGGKEAEKALAIRDELSSKVNELLGAAKQLHDGSTVKNTLQT